MRNESKLYKWFFTSLCVLMTLFYLSPLVINRQTWLDRRFVVEGMLTERIPEPRNLSDLSDICILEECLYLLYGRKGIVKVYDSAGNYITSFYFSHTNGLAELFSDDHCVYIRDRDKNLYRMAQGKYDGFIPGDRENPEYQAISAAFGPREALYRSGTDVYAIRLGSVYKTAADGTRAKIVQAPLLAPLFQDSISFFVGVAMMLAVVCAERYGQEKGLMKKRDKYVPAESSRLPPRNG